MRAEQAALLSKLTYLATQELKTKVSKTLRLKTKKPDLVLGCIVAVPGLGIYFEFRMLKSLPLSAMSWTLTCEAIDLYSLMNTPR